MGATPMEAQIRAYLLDAFLSDMAPGTLGNSDNFLSLLNSLELLRMVIDLESTYGVKVDDSELNAENLGSVEKIAAFIARKQQ